MTRAEYEALMDSKTPEQLCRIALALLQNHEYPLALKAIRRVDYLLSVEVMRQEQLK